MCLTTSNEVAGSIPATFTIFKSGLGLERGLLIFMKKIRWLLDYEIEDIIKKFNLIDL